VCVRIGPEVAERVLLRIGFHKGRFSSAYVTA